MPSGSRTWLAAIGAAFLLAAVAAVVVSREAPGPVAAAALGTDDVFGSGLHERQFQPVLHRWTTERAVFRFRDVPAGAVPLTVAVHGHRDWVAVIANGRPLGTLEPGQAVKTYSITVPGDGRVEVELRVRPFTPGDGRQLGAQLGRVELGPWPRSGLTAGMLAVFALPAVCVAIAMLAGGWGAGVAIATTAVVLAAQAALLIPWGIVRSSYAVTLAGVVAVSAGALLGLARVAERRWPGAGRWAMVAGLAALLVQGLAATWPAMLASDVVMNAHNLEKVSAGDWWLVSRTQHKPPFAFPYGPAFYALLVPLERAGFDPATVVRVAAAVAGVLGSLGLFALLASSSPSAAAAAVVALQLLPGTFDRYSYGNLSNVFAQSMAILFFAGWARRAPGGPLPGALFLVLAALGHFSGAIVLAVLLLALAAVGRGGRELPRSARIAVVVACLLVVAYYATFLPLMLRQLPRVFEGAGQGPAGSTWGTLLKQWDEIRWEWGLPAVVLAWVGRPRRHEGVEADLRAFWVAGGILAVLALVSPVEARYLYALTLPLAVAMASGAVELARQGGPRAWILAVLVAAQLWLALANLRHDLYVQYRG